MSKYEIKDGLLIILDTTDSYVFRIKDIMSYSTLEGRVILLMRDATGSVPQFWLETESDIYTEEHGKEMHELLEPLRKALDY